MFFSALYELLMFVHSILRSVLVAEWPPFGKKSCSLGHMFSLNFDYLLFSLFPVRDVDSDFGVSCLCNFVSG